MKKLVALIAVAVALGWGALALNVDNDSSPAQESAPVARDVDDDRPEAPREHAPTPHVAVHAVEAEPEAPLHALPSVAPGPEERPVDAEFEMMARLYVTEARDGDWALKHEQRMAEMLESPETKESVHVHCRTTVCRLTVARGAPQDLLHILAKPGVREATHLDASSPYAFEAGAFTLYYRRIGDPEPTLP